MRLLGLLITMLTTYANGFFITETQVTATADMPACSAVVDSLISYIQTDPKSLSTWPFAGCGHQKDAKRDAVFLVWKDSNYDPQAQISHMTVDVLVEGKPMFRNILITSSVHDSIVNDIRTIRVNISYSGSLLKQAWGEFHLIPDVNNTIRMLLKVNVKFGWFFRLFISQQVYSNAVDWRIERLLHNMALYAQGVMVDDAYWKQRDKQVQ